MHLLLVLLNKQNLLKTPVLTIIHLHAVFPIFERCDVIVTHYFIKDKCFSFYTLPKLASYSDSIC